MKRNCIVLFRSTLIVQQYKNYNNTFASQSEESATDRLRLLNVFDNYLRLDNVVLVLLVVARFSPPSDSDSSYSAPRTVTALSLRASSRPPPPPSSSLCSFLLFFFSLLLLVAGCTSYNSSTYLLYNGMLGGWLQQPARPPHAIGRSSARAAPAPRAAGAVA